MNSAFFRAVILASLALCPCHGFEPGPRPSAAVFDPDGILGKDARAEVSLPLVKIRKEENVEVIAAVLTKHDHVSPEEAAAKIAAAWCDAPLHAVVLHVPGREGSPWIVAGGELIQTLDPGEVRDELALARRDASREPDDAAKLRTAATATADLLRYWKGREASRRAIIDNLRAGIRLELEARAHQQQILMLTAAASAIPLIAGAVLAIRLLGKSRRASTRMS